MAAFDDMFDDVFAARGSARAGRRPPEKGVQIHGRKIDDAYYVRAEDVVALLEANDILPATVVRLKAAMDR